MANIRLSLPAGSAEGYNLRFIAVLVALALSASCSQRPKPTIAENIRNAALVKAKAEGKQVLLVFVQPGTIFSDLLDQFHADPAVDRVLTQHFVLTRINIESPGGMEMHWEYAPRNMPALVIRGSDGAYLADSGDGDQNFGFPNNPEQVERYIAMLKTACPTLTEDESSVLISKLEALRTN